MGATHARCRLGDIEAITVGLFLAVAKLKIDIVSGNRMHGGRHSVGDFDPSRPHSGANLQNFYASQRHQGRHNDAEQMLQAKRRMAAQRERELRNYHQEQQYNRSEQNSMPEHP
jgi:hypothetical protein